MTKNKKENQSANQNFIIIVLFIMDISCLWISSHMKNLIHTITINNSGKKMQTNYKAI